MLGIYSTAVLIMIVLEWYLVEGERHTRFAIADWQLNPQQLQVCWIPSQATHIRN